MTGLTPGLSTVDTISAQNVNWKLKELVKKFEVVKNPTRIKSHSLRKSFGRRVFENNDNSEKV
jgi:hypothetical protein